MNPGGVRLRYLNLMSIFQAAQSGDVNRLDTLLQSNPKLVHARSLGDGATPLLAAVRCGQVDAVICCLKHGADPQVGDGKGMNALHLACKKGDGKRLLDEASCAHHNNNHHNTTDDDEDNSHHHRQHDNDPLSTITVGAEADEEHSSSSSDAFITRHLLRQRCWRSGGAVLDAADDAEGRTALHHACTVRNVEAVRLLIRARADFSLRDGGGSTALDLAQAVMAQRCASVIMAAEKAYMLHKARHVLEAERIRDYYHHHYHHHRDHHRAVGAVREGRVSTRLPMSVVVMTTSAARRRRRRTSIGEPPSPPPPSSSSPQPPPPRREAGGTGGSGYGSSSTSSSRPATTHKEEAVEEEEGDGRGEGDDVMGFVLSGLNQDLFRELIMGMHGSP